MHRRKIKDSPHTAFDKLAAYALSGLCGDGNEPDMYVVRFHELRKAMRGGHCDAGNGAPDFSHIRVHGESEQETSLFEPPVCKKSGAQVANAR